MCHGSQICNSDIKNTFATIVENLKGENVNLYFVNGRGGGGVVMHLQLTLNVNSEI